MCRIRPRRAVLVFLAVAADKVADMAQVYGRPTAALDHWGDRPIGCEQPVLPVARRLYCVNRRVLALRAAAPAYVAEPDAP